jgi:ketosteroid isomerase-like protein
MKSPGGFRELASFTLVLPSLVVVAALALAACGGSSESGSAASSTTPSTAASAATVSPAASDPAQVARTESVVTALMTAWNNAWSAKKDRRAQSSLYADDVQYYDAAETYALITKSDMDAMSQDPEWWKAFRLTLESSFVSCDGRFAATLGKIALRDESGDLNWQPAVSVLAAANDKIVWQCDYWGGEPGVAGQTKPMLAVPSGALAPGSPAANTAVAEATATIEQWLAAYNGRDAATFLSFYAEDARYVDLVSPKWRVMTKSQLAADVASRFPRDEFQSKLERPLGSATDSAYFVSPDGRFAAVQGTYLDRGTPGGLPMLIVLELEAGQIVRQHNYVAMDRSLLEP